MTNRFEVSRSKSRLGHDDLELKNGFCSIAEEHLGPGTSYLVCRLVMTPIDFEVSRSKVKVTVTLNGKMVFAQ